ncbi:MAG TPA: Holliday junction branch migration protein RuvA, partial [Kofleriaceae bacterium]
MISRLSGVLIEREHAGNAPHVTVDCNGVGYDVIVSLYTHGALPAAGEPVVLKIFTHATENRLALFGFLEATERELFDLLITVKNVGPSTAIAILSGSSPHNIAELISRQDVPGLTKIKGVGKKTAELLAVELHEKCAELVVHHKLGTALHTPIITKRNRSTGNPMVDEVRLALVGLGWSPNEAEAAVIELSVSAEATTESLLRQALRS